MYRTYNLILLNIYLYYYILEYNTYYTEYSMSFIKKKYKSF